MTKKSKNNRFRNTEEYSEFLSVAYHQVKNPLTSIYGYIHLLDKQKGADEKSKKYIEKIKKQTENVIRIIQNLSVVNKILKKKDKNNLEILQFDKVVLDMITLIQQKNPSFTITVQGKSEKYIIFNKEQLEFIIQNIALNAIKFSKAGSKIKANLSSEKNKVCFSVEDFGIGVPVGRKDEVFKPFSPLFFERKEQYPGSGLGLFVSREILLTHKGSMHCIPLDKGIKMCISLPAVQTT